MSTLRVHRCPHLAAQVRQQQEIYENIRIPPNQNEKQTTTKTTFNSYLHAHLRPVTVISPLNSAFKKGVSFSAAVDMCEPGRGGGDGGGAALCPGEGRRSTPASHKHRQLTSCLQFGYTCQHETHLWSFWPKRAGEKRTVSTGRLILQELCRISVMTSSVNPCTVKRNCTGFKILAI